MKLYQGLTLFALTSFSTLANSQPHLLGNFPLTNAAFVRLVEGRDIGTKELVVSSFGVFGGDAITRIPLSETSFSNFQGIKPEVISHHVDWPNESTPVPEEVFGADYLAFGTGFLVPGRSTGNILIVNKYRPDQFIITHPKSEFFYHRVEWVDMNGDGLLDIVTARARKQLFTQGEGELLWLEQPRENRRNPWKEHILAEGPDVHFVTTDLDRDERPEIIATEFFARKLRVFRQENGIWKSSLIDSVLGAAFDLIIADLNIDGRDDLVVTNHEGGRYGAVYAYEIPDDFMNQPWTRHTLLSGIQVVVSEMNAATPGSPVIWDTHNGNKPRILVGGDGSGKLHMLEPISEELGNWSYQEKILLSTHSTIGRIWIDRFEQSQNQFLFVPSYDEGRVYVFELF